MRTELAKQTLTEATPGSASTAAGASITGLDKYSAVRFEVTITGGTGGTLDVYLQRQCGKDGSGNQQWVDFVHFPQVAATVVKRYSASSMTSTSIVEVGGGTDAAPGVALAANTNVGGHPGSVIRPVYVAGAGTSVAGSCTIRVFGTKP